MCNIDCLVEDNCQNYDDMCLLCHDQSKYKPFKTKSSLSRSPSKKKKGMGFEEKTKKRYEKSMAKRMPQSGGFDGMEGDVSIDRLLLECKERNTIDSKGKKTIGIKKEWLEKIEEEAKMHDKLPALVFGYKESDDMYFTMKYEYLLDLLVELKNLRNLVEQFKSN